MRAITYLAAIAFLFWAGPLIGAEPGPDARPSMDMAIRLMYGTNNKPQEPDPEVAKLVDTLKRDFGYLNYELKKSEHVTLKFDETATKDLGDELIFIVRNLGVYKGQRKVWLELWFRGKKIAGAFSLFPKPANPILIKGPNTDEGTYIIVLSLVNGEAQAQ
jgi:hypothetical protein